MKTKVINKELTVNEVVEQGVPGTYNLTEDGTYTRAEVDSSSEDEANIDVEAQQNSTAKAYEVKYISLYLNKEEEDRVKHLHRFYTVELVSDKITGKKKIKKIELDNFAIINVLRDLGFYRYDQPNGTFEYVKIENNIITLLRDPQVIIDAFEDYVREIPTLYYRTDDATEVVEKDEEKCIKYILTIFCVL